MTAETADIAAPSQPRPAPKRSGGLRQPLPPGRAVLIGLVSGLGLLLLWEAASAAGLLNPVYAPAPSKILGTLWRMVWERHLLYHAGVSILRVWTAFLLSAIFAIPIGVAMTSFRWVGAALEPIVDFIRYLPVPALVPLTIIWFGVGEEAKIFLLWLGTFFQLVLLVADDMCGVPQEYLEIGMTLGGNRFQVLRDVALRAMLPNLFDTLRVTMGWCWTYLIIAEIVAADSGLGFVIWTARRYMQTAEVMAGVMTIGLIGLATDQTLRYLYRRLFRYL